MYKITALFLIFILFLSACIRTTRDSKSSIKEPSIALVKENADVYLDTQVTLKGFVRTWKEKYGPPPVRTSDWVLEDNTGFIYVSGGHSNDFSHSDLIDKSVTVMGEIRRSGSDMVYLKFIAHIE